MARPQALAVRRALEHYLRFLRVERNLSPRTQKAYAGDLGRFIAWLEEALARPDPPVHDILPDHVESYLAHQRRERGHRPATLARDLSSLCGLFNYLVEHELLEQSPAQHLARPKQPRKLPVYLVEDEIRRLLDAPDTTTAPGRRDRAILVTLAFTGLRLQELVGLDPTDVDFSRATLRVLGKGRKERLVPMNGSVVEALTCYLEDPGRVPAPGERALFLNRFGGRLTGRSVENIVAAHLRAAGLTRPGLSPHKLRHSFATLLHSRQVDLVDIQTLMGHASLASTQVYTHTDAERLRGAIEKIPTPKGLA